MKRFPRRALSLLVTVSLLAMAATSIAVAAVPNVYLSVVASPLQVTKEQPIGFVVTVDNQDSSTASQSGVTAPVPTGTTYKTVYPAGTDCSSDGALVTCNLGNIAGHTSVTFALVFDTTASTPLSATLNATGTTTGSPGDPGGNSHGDSFLCAPCSATTTLSLKTDVNFYGGFVVDDSLMPISTSFILSKTNTQGTSVKPPKVGIGVSVQDGPDVANLGVCGSTGNTDVTPSVCSQLFGENSALYVAGNEDFYPTAFKVTILFGKYELPSGVNKNNIAVYHTWTDSSGGFHEEVIDTACTYNSSGAPTNAQCLTAKNTSDGILADIWVFHNGNMKGF